MKRKAWVGDKPAHAALAHRRRGGLEFLYPAAEADFGGIEIAFRINSDVVHPLELAGLAAVTAPLRKHLPVLARQHTDLAIGTVRHEDETLLRIARQHQVPNRAVRQGLRIEAELLDEGTVLTKDLNAIVDAVADIDQAVVRQPHAVHGVAELCDSGAAEL